MSTKFAEKQYWTLHDMWVNTYPEGQSTLAYASMNSFSHALLDAMRDFKTAKDVRDVIESLHDGTRWNRQKRIALDDARRIVASLPSDRKGVPKVFGGRSTNTVRLSDQTASSASQCVEQGLSLVSRDQAMYFTKFTVPQLIQLDREGIFPVKRNGSRVGYTDRQVQGLAILNRINAIKDLRAVRSAIAKGALSKIEDESVDFFGMSLAGYGTYAEWVPWASVNSWLHDTTIKFGQGCALNLISYDETVSRLEKLQALLN